jgi:hypothetical protein
MLFCSVLYLVVLTGLVMLAIGSSKNRRLAIQLAALILAIPLVLIVMIFLAMRNTHI